MPKGESGEIKEFDYEAEKAEIEEQFKKDWEALNVWAEQVAGVIPGGADKGKPNWPKIHANESHVTAENERAIKKEETPELDNFEVGVLNLTKREQEIIAERDRKLAELEQRKGKGE